MWLDVSLALVACLTAILGVIVTFWPPNSRKWKLILFAAFVVLASVGVVLVYIQSNQRQQEQDQAAIAQQQADAKQRQLQDSVDSLKKQLDEVQRITSQPPPKDEKLSSTLSNIDTYLSQVKDRPPTNLKRRTLQLAKDIITLLAEREQKAPPYYLRSKTWEENQKIGDIRDAYNHETISLYKLRFSVAVNSILPEIKAQGVKIDDTDEFIVSSPNNLLGVEDVGTKLASWAGQLP
ncbi:MAG: hypothetical protein WCF57_04370 [Pyrinomonadaceae bacterium]